MTQENVKICVVGLGYVGLPLAVAFGRTREVVGFDLNQARVDQLSNGIDLTREVTAQALQQSKGMKVTADVKEIEDCTVYIVTVPTPIDEHNQPNLMPIKRASETIGAVLNQGDVVVYESTVYPGATEEVCVPLLESKSGLIFNQGFYVGYSPERINPGDTKHRLETIVKVVAGSTPEITLQLSEMYAEVVEAGIHSVNSIKVAEAAKVIENTQRDVNIALVNELAMIFNLMDIDTSEVLEAASTKWNFLPFRPGIVGGHCIGVDPYYLTQKAQSIGYHPEMILAGRRINDNMGNYIVGQIVKGMIQKRIAVMDSRILMLGLTFKENCPDIRNTRVVDLVREFSNYGAKVDVYDPWVDPEDALREYQINLIDQLQDDSYDAVVVAVAHEEFVTLGSEKLRGFGKANHILYDLKGVFSADETDARL